MNLKIKFSKTSIDIFGKTIPMWMERWWTLFVSTGLLITANTIMTVSVVNGSRSPWNFLYNILWIFLLFFFPPLMVRYSKKHRQKLARLREEQLRKDEKS